MTHDEMVAAVRPYPHHWYGRCHRNYGGGLDLLVTYAGDPTIYRFSLHMPAINPDNGIGPIAVDETYPHFTQYYLATGLTYVGICSDYVDDTTADVDATMASADEGGGAPMTEPPATMPSASMADGDDAMAAAVESGGAPIVEEADTMVDDGYVPVYDPSVAMAADAGA